MEIVRHHLRKAVARSRPELELAQQQRLVDQILELIGSTTLASGTGPVQMIATGEAPDFPNRLRGDQLLREPELGRVAFAIVCGHDGTIEQVMRGGLELGPQFSPGRMLTALVAPFHSRKAGRFLRDLHSERPVFDCSLSTLGLSDKIRLFWSGVPLECGIIVVGTKEPLSDSVPEQLAELAKDQPDAIRPFLAELSAWRKRRTSSVPLSPDDSGHATVMQAHSAVRGMSHAVPGRRRLLDLAAHDLCNPISAIVSACEYLIEDAAGVLEPRHMLFLHSIAASGRKTLKVVQDMAEIPRIRLNQPALDLKPTDIVSVMQEEVASLLPLANDMNVTVALNFGKLMPAFTGDSARLREALHGLLVNAIGPAAVGGRIEIDIAGGKDDISVALHRIFLVAPCESYPETTGSRKNPRRISDVYSALLLLQARSIVNAHGGVLRVESHRKHGPCWTVTLPAAAPALIRGSSVFAG